MWNFEQPPPIVQFVEKKNVLLNFFFSLLLNRKILSTSLPN